MYPTRIKMLAGTAIIGAILVYGFGNSFTQSALNGLSAATAGATVAQPALYKGVLLMLLNSVFVVIIGDAVFRLVPASQRFDAGVYLVARIAEAVLLAIGAFCLLSVARSAAPELMQQRNVLFYNLGMVMLGTGSLFLFYRLRSSGFFPRWLLIWGMAGYAGLLFGALLDLSGSKMGIWFAIPGGLFELVWGLLWIGEGLRAGRS